MAARLSRKRLPRYGLDFKLKAVRPTRIPGRYPGNGSLSDATSTPGGRLVSSLLAGRSSACTQQLMVVTVVSDQPSRPPAGADRRPVSDAFYAGTGINTPSLPKPDGAKSMRSGGEEDESPRRPRGREQSGEVAAPWNACSGVRLSRLE